MRKIISHTLFIVLITTVGFSSCKKDYTCTCTTVNGTVYTSYIKTTKKKAVKFCNDQQTNGRTCTLN